MFINKRSGGNAQGFVNKGTDTGDEKRKAVKPPSCVRRALPLNSLSGAGGTMSRDRNYKYLYTSTQCATLPRDDGSLRIDQLKETNT